jgi:hypothetical protein
LIVVTIPILCLRIPITNPGRLPLEAALSPITHLYETTDRLIPEIISPLEEEDLSFKPNNWNSVLRLYAHVTVLRHRLYNALTKRADPVPFEECCGGYPSPDDELPRVEEVNQAYEGITKRLHGAFEELTEEDLEAEGKGIGFFPTSDHTLLGTITFLGYHEAYTVGQMGYVGHLTGKLPKTGVLG